MKLSNKTIAVLYLTLFNISETGKDEEWENAHVRPIDNLLKENGYLGEDAIPDEDGCPCNETQDIIDEYQGFFLSESFGDYDSFIRDWIDEANPTEEYLKSIIDTLAH